MIMLDENMVLAKCLVWGQCSEIIRTKLEAN